MATKTKPQGSRFKKFEICTKITKVSKPQGPKWQFTLIIIIIISKIYIFYHKSLFKIHGLLQYYSFKKFHLRS
ncbi:hypothetical protein Hanom_Chr14g01275421 [Helianthus anomalus]